MSVQDELFPLPETPKREEEPRSNNVDIWCQQFVNRWVFLRHQRDAALTELRELVAAACAPIEAP